MQVTFTSEKENFTLTRAGKIASSFTESNLKDLRIVLNIADAISFSVLVNIVLLI